MGSLTITRHDKFECYSQVLSICTLHVTAQAVNLLEHKLSHLD